MNLVIYVGEDRESYGQITALINRSESESIVLVKNKKVIDFPFDERCKIIEVDTSADINSLREDIKEKVKKEIGKEFEISLSIASGTGKEHMALISALLAIPVGVKFVVFTRNGIEFIN